MHLGLHEREEPGPVLLVELLQGLDLALQRGPLGREAADDLVVPALGRSFFFSDVFFEFIFDEESHPRSRVETLSTDTHPGFWGKRRMV